MRTTVAACPRGNGILIDDGSVTPAETWREDVRLIRNEQALGVPPARRAGAQFCAPGARERCPRTRGSVPIAGRERRSPATPVWRSLAMGPEETAAVACRTVWLAAF